MKTQGFQADPPDEHHRVLQQARAVDSSDMHGFGFDHDDETWLRGLRRHLLSDQHGEPACIGPFRVLAEIGRGGQGVVLKAFDPRTRRTVAIKRLSAGVFASPEMQARFEREVEAAASLDHPSVVTVYGTEQIDGQSILVMQWIDGVPIDRWAASSANPPPLEQLLVVFAAVCDAVHHAHQRGVIHRDLKPTNILVDAAGVPHVLDFGLAKLRSEDPHTTEITQSGIFLGTPSFAAPEQLRGEIRSIDIRTDVFALGQVLHMLLEGAPAFSPQSPIFQRLAIMESQSIQPAKTLQRGARGREVALILATALRFAPDERYASVAALAEDLRRLLRGEALQAHPPSVRYRIAKFARRHRLAVSAVCAVSLILIAATIVSTSLYVKAQRNAVRANMSAQLARDEAENARKVTSFVKAILAQTTPHTFRPDRVNFGELLENAARKVTQASLRPEIEAEIRGVLSEAFGSIGLYQAAAREAERGLEIAQAHTLPPLQHALLLMQKGLSEYKAGALQEADRLMREALQITTDAVGPEHIETFELRKNYALVQHALGRFEDAHANLQEVLAMEQMHLGNDSEKLVTTYGSLSIVRKSLAQFDQALDAARRGQQLAELHKNQDSVKPLLCALDIAALQNDMEQFADAKAQIEDVLPPLTALLGEDHPHVANAWNSLGVAEAGLRNMDAARAAFAKALDTNMKSGGDPLSVALITQNQAHILAGAGDHAGALAAMEQALEIRRQIRPADHPEIADSLYDMGWEYLELNEKDKALQAFQQSIAINRNRGPDRLLELSSALSGLGTALTELQHWPQAQAALEECAAIRRDLLGTRAQEWMVVSVVRQLGWLAFKQGDLRTARQLLEDSVPQLWNDPAASPWVRTRAAEQLLEFYHATGEPSLATQWQQRLAGSNASQN